VQKEHYDLIFMDALMPQMDGIETLRNMNQLVNSKCKDVPVVILTADAVTGAKERYLKKGFQDFLSKPVIGEDLESMILKYLPEEKLLREEMFEEADSEEVWEEKLLNRLNEEIPQIETETGMCYCGDDPKLYVEILTAFVEDDKCDQLDNFYEKEEWTGYQIAIHTIKGLLKTVGALGMYEDALRLEQWTKEMEYDVLRQNHDYFSKQYRELIEQIHDCIEQCKA